MIDTEQTGPDRVRELMRQAADDYRPSVDLVPGAVRGARRIQRNRAIAFGVGGTAAAVAAAVLTVTMTGVADTAPVNAGGPGTADSAGTTSAATIYVSDPTPPRLPGTVLSPTGSNYDGPSSEVSIQNGAVSDPCVYMLTTWPYTDHVSCVFHLHPDLPAPGSALPADGALYDTVQLTYGEAAPPSGESDCGLQVLVVLATRDVAHIDFTSGVSGQIVGGSATLIPENTGGAADYAAVVTEVGAQFTYTGDAGGTSAPQTISTGVPCTSTAG